MNSHITSSCFRFEIFLEIALEILFSLIITDLNCRHNIIQQKKIHATQLKFKLSSLISWKCSPKKIIFFFFDSNLLLFDLILNTNQWFISGCCCWKFSFTRTTRKHCTEITKASNKSHVLQSKKNGNRKTDWNFITWTFNCTNASASELKGNFSAFHPSPRFNYWFAHFMFSHI